MMLILFVLSVSSGGPGWSMRPVSPASPASFLVFGSSSFEFRVAEFRVVCSSGSSSSSSMKRGVVVTSASDIRHRIEVLDDVDPFCACRFIWRAWVERGSRSGAPEHADFYLRGREVSTIATYRFEQGVSESSAL